MAFQSLTIDLNANLQKLQGDLDQAQQISDQALGRITKSATDAGHALGNAANQADFSDLSSNAKDAAASMDALQKSTTGTGTAADQAKGKLAALFEEIDTKAGEAFDNLEGKAKTVGIVTIAATGVLVAATLGAVAAAVYRIGVVAVEAAGFVAGLFTGTSYQTKYIDSLIAANDRVKELQTSLGITAQSAAALELALNRIGTPKGDYTAVFTATEKAVASNADAFNQLGIAYQDTNGKALATQTVIQNAAKVLDTYTAGLDRNAAAAALGLGAADKVAAAAKLNAGNFDEAAQRLQAYYLVIGPGSQAATAAYEQAMRVFRSESDLTSEGFKRAIADATMPILTEFAELLKDGFPGAVSAFRTSLSTIVGIFEVFEAGAKALYEIVSFDFAALEIGVNASMAAINKAIHFDFSGAKKEVDEGSAAIEARFGVMLDNVTRNRDKANAAYDLASGRDSQTTPTMDDRIRGKTYFGAIDFGSDDKKASTTPNVDVAKKQLEEQLKALEVFIAEERTQLTERDQFLDLYYQHGDVSIRDYFAQRKTAQDAYVASAKQGYNEEIADLQAYIAKTQGNGALSEDQKTARVAEAQTKLIDVRGKLRKVESDANQETLKDWFANRDAVEQFGDQLNSLVAQIKTFSGDTAGAFDITFDAQYRKLKQQLDAVRNSDSSTQAERNQAAQAIVDLDQVRQQGIATAKLNDLTSARNVVLGDLANTQARIDLAVSTGQKSELQGLADASAANAARLESLKKIAGAYDAIAAASNNPQDRINADALHVELEKLATQTDLVADKFNAIGESATENLINKIGTGTFKARDLLKSFVSDIQSAIFKISAQQVGSDLFGQQGLLSGVGKFASSFFPASQGASGVGASAGVAALGTAATPAAVAVTALSTAAAAATTALASFALGSDASIVSNSSSEFSSLLGTLGAFGSAKGNVFAGGNVVPFARGGIVSSPTIVPMALMGEAGREAIVPLRASDRTYRDSSGNLRIDDGSGGPSVVNNSFTVPTATSRQSQAQIVNNIQRSLSAQARRRSA